MHDFIRLVFHSLKSRKVRSWLTMVGVFVGIAAVVSLIGLGEGLRETISGQFNLLSTDVLAVQASGLQAGPPGTGVVDPLKDYYEDDVENLPGVAMVITRHIENAELTFEGVSDFTFVGSAPEDKKLKELQRVAQLDIAKGRIIQEKDRNKVVLGDNYASGKKFSKPLTLRDKVLIQEKEFEVVGFFEKKGSFIIDNAILMTEESVKELYDINDSVDIMMVIGDKGVDLDRVKERVENYLRKERDVDKGEEDFSVESPEQAIQTLDSTLFAVQLFVYIIAAISIVVGGIGITNTMYTSILERTKEIGIMKSIGAKNRDIFALFFLESGMLGAVGGLLGIIAGVSLAYLLAFVAGAALNTELLTVSISPWLLAAALLFSFIVGTIAGLLPALQAAKLNPVDALQYAK